MASTRTTWPGRLKHGQGTKISFSLFMAFSLSLSLSLSPVFLSLTKFSVCLSLSLCLSPFLFFYIFTYLCHLSARIHIIVDFDTIFRIYLQLHLSPKMVGLYEITFYFSRQYESSKTEEIEAMNRLMEWLPKNIPRQVVQILSVRPYAVLLLM